MRGEVDATVDDTGSGRDWLWIGAVAVAIIGAAFAFWVLYDSSGDFGQIDYRIYAGSASDFVYGRSLYHYVHPEFHLSATYPPAGLLLFVPISLVNTRVAEAIWLLANLACIVGILWLVCTHFLRLSDRRRMLVCVIGPSLAVPTTLMWRNLQLGQINLWLWLAIVGDLVLVQKRSRYAGLLIGLAAAVKLTPAIFILFLFVISAWRPAVRAVAAFVGATALAWAIAPDDSHLFWTTLLFDTSRIGDMADGHNNSLRFLLANLPISGTVQVGVWLVVGAVVVPFGLWRASREWRAGHLLYAMLIVGCVQGLISPITWQHHLIFLLLALLLLPMPAWRPGTGIPWPQVAVLALGWLFFIDPVAFGVNRVTAAVRCLLLLAIVAGLVLRPTSWLEENPEESRETGSRRRLAAGPAVL